MTRKDFEKISMNLFNELEAVHADALDYYCALKMVTSLYLFKLHDLGADDGKIMEAIDFTAEQLKSDMREAWPQIKNNAIVMTN